MSPERWIKIEPLLNEALDLPPAKRNEFLTQVCNGNQSLRLEIEALLAQEERIDSFIEEPILPLPDDIKQMAQEGAVKPALPTEPLTGKQLGKYKIRSLLGKGGMGEVYLAYDAGLDREVALKFLPPEVARDPEQTERFKREARTLAKLENHPNIAVIHDLELNNPTPFLVLEYVPGQTLAERLQQGALPLAEALPVFRQIAAALTEAQKRGIIHRDLKPANIKITPEGRVKVLDFGLAKILAEQAQTADVAEPQFVTTRSFWTTDRQVIIGTVPYMSPEQTRGLPVDQRTDNWAFGCVMFEALTGQRPFQGSDTFDLFHAIRTYEPNWQSLPADTPNAIRTLLQRCLHKEPEARLAAASEASCLLTEQLEKAPLPQLALQVKRWKNQIVFAVALSLMLGLGVIYRQPLQARIQAFFTAPAKTLVILPFKEIGNTSKEDKLGRGLAKSLQDLLSSVADLRVLPVAEALQANLGNVGAERTAKTLGVNLLLSGEVQRESNALTIRYQVQNERGAILLRDVAQGRNDEYAKLRASIVAKVTQVLNLASPKLPTSAVFKNSDAEEKFLEAVGALQSDLTQESIEPVIQSLEDLRHTQAPSAHILAVLAQAYFQKAMLTNDPVVAATALNFAQEAINLDNTVLEVNVVRGQAFLFLEDYDQAIESFLKARDQQPSNLVTLSGLATTYQDKAVFGGQKQKITLDQQHELLRKAQDTFQTAVLFWPLFWGAHNELGAFYFNRGKYEQAIKEWERVVELNPTGPGGYINLGNAYIKLGQNEAAEKSFRQAFDQLSEKKQTREEAFLGWGTAVYYQGKFPDAANIFNLGIESYPQSYLLQINLGDALRQSGQETEALAAYQKAIALIQNTKRGATGLAHLAEVYAKRSQITGVQNSRLDIDRQHALTKIDKAIASATQDDDILTSAILVYYLTGDKTKALEYCQQAWQQGYSLNDLEHDPDLRPLCMDEQYIAMKRQVAKTS